MQRYFACTMIFINVNAMYISLENVLANNRIWNRIWNLQNNPLLIQTLNFKISTNDSLVQYLLKYYLELHQIIMKAANYHWGNIGHITISNGISISYIATVKTRFAPIRIYGLRILVWDEFRADAMETFAMNVIQRWFTSQSKCDAPMGFVKYVSLCILVKC